MKTELIIFDLGKVLVDFEFKKIVTELKKFTPLEERDIYAWFEGTPLWDSFERGKISEHRFFEELKKSLGLRDLSYAQFLPIWNGMFSEMHDTVDIVRRLHGNYRLAILSNVNVLHWQHVQHYPFIKLFDHPVASYAVGHRKPDPEIFAHILKQAGFAPEQAVFIDDLESHILSARKLGIRSHLFTGAPQLIEDLGEILHGH